MSAVFFLIPLALILLVFAAWSIVWAVRNKQFDDLESPSHRILFDDKETTKEIKNKAKLKNKGDNH